MQRSSHCQTVSAVGFAAVAVEGSEAVHSPFETWAAAVLDLGTEPELLVAVDFAAAAVAELVAHEVAADAAASTDTDGYTAEAIAAAGH